MVTMRAPLYATRPVGRERGTLKASSTFWDSGSFFASLSGLSFSDLAAGLPAFFSLLSSGFSGGGNALSRASR